MNHEGRKGWRWKLNNVSALQWYQLLRFGSVILLSILLARSPLGDAGVAGFERLLYLGQVMTFFWLNPWLEGMLPVIPTLDQERKKVFLFNLFVLFSLFALVVSGSLYFGGAYLGKLLTRQWSIEGIRMYAWVMLFDLPSYLVLHFYVIEKKHQALLVYAGVTFSSWLIAIALPVWLGYSLETGIWLWSLAAFLRWCWLLVLVKRMTLPKIKPTVIWSFIVLSYPLMLYAIMSGVAPLFDNWLIQWFFHNDQQFAQFRIGARELPLGIALAGGITAALSLEMASDLNTALPVLKNSGRKMMHWLFPLSLGLMFAAPYLFQWFYGNSLSAASAVFQTFLLIACSRVLLPNPIVLGLRRNRTISMVALLELIANVGLSFLLIRWWGLVGVALGTVIAFWLEKVVLMALLWYRHNIPPGAYTDLKVYGFYSFAMLIAYWWNL